MNRITGYLKRNDLRLSPMFFLQTLRLRRVVVTEGRRSPACVMVQGSVALELAATAHIRIQTNGRLLLGVGKTAGSYHSDRSLLEMGEDAVWDVNGHVRLLPGFRISIGPRATLAIGEASWFNSDARILVRNRVSIGSGCAIAWRVTIMDTDFHSLRVEKDSDNHHTESITIGDHVWIGAESMVLKGVTIGDGSVVAARSVVTKDVPPGVLVAGQPAKIVREDVSWG
jgi:acetyltransferase-like isoleucine patch superfamily enzyme